MQKGGIEATGQEFAFAYQHKVRGARLLHLSAGTEQHLIDLVFGPGAQRGAQGGGVISAGLDHAHLRCRTRVFIVDQNAQRLHAAGKIIPHWTCEHDQRRFCRGRRGRTDVRSRTKQDGPEVQGARSFRHRIAAAIDHGAHHAGELCRIRFGQHQCPSALPHALNVPIHAKDVYGSVGTAECLESLEAGARIMQHMRGGTEFDRLYRLDLARAPAASLIRGHGHMRGQQRAESGSLGLRSHLDFTLGIKIVAGCSSSSFSA